MSWRGEKGGIEAAEQGHDVVMAPNQYTYFDYYQKETKDDEPLAIGGMLPLEKVYSYEPFPEELPEEKHKHILGGQGQLWTEYIPDINQLEYMAFPRACALSEVLWLDPDKKDFDDFKLRFADHRKRLHALAVNYCK